MSRLRFRRTIAGKSNRKWGNAEYPQIMVSGRGDYLAAVGGWSSHPTHAAARLRAVRYAAFGTALILVGLLALAWFTSVRPSDVVAMILEFPAWIDRQATKIAVIACILGAAMTVVLTASVQIRASLIPNFAQRGRRSISLEVACVLALLAVSAALPFVVARIDHFWVRLFAHILALAPLPFLIAFLEYAAAAPKNGDVRFNPSRFATTAIVVGLIVTPFMLFQYAADALETDLAGWIAGLLPIDTLTRFIDGGRLGPDAPDWLRGIEQGRYGEEAKKLLDAALAAIGSGADPAKELVASIQTALAPWIARILRIVALVLLLPATAAAVGLSVFYAGAIRSSVQGSGDGATPKKDEKSDRKGCIGWLVHVVCAPFRWFARGSDASASAAPSPAERVAQLMKALQEDAGASALDGVESIVAPDPRPEATVPPFDQTWADPMFDGHRPSVDQINALEAFVNRYIAHLEEAETEGFGGDPHTHADFFIESSPGCGATSTLLALAFYAATVRGQKVLLLVSDKWRQKEAIERCNRMLKAVRMHELVTVNSFSEEEVGDWYMNYPRVERGEMTADRGYRGVPEILVSTIEEWERVSQSPAFNRADELLRSVMLDTEVVLVDDFARGADTARQSLHLPFMLDKHRLVLQGELRSLQLVIAAPTLDDGTRELLARRLFGGNGRAHAVPLRRFRAATDHTLEVVASSRRSIDALRSCAQRCMALGFPAVVYRPNIDVVAAAELVEQLSGAHGVPAVVGHVDDLPQESRRGMSAILYREGIGEDPGYSLAARIEGAACLILRIREASIASLVTESNPIPVLASPHARAPFFAHLRSACRFIRPSSPVHRNDWARFGLRIRGETEPLECGVGETFHRDPVLPSFTIDPPEPMDLSDRSVIQYDQAGVWPFVSMRPIAGIVPSCAVAINSPIEDGVRIHLSSDRDGFLLGDSGRIPDRRRHAKWISARDEELGEIDLGHASLLLFRQGDILLRPESVESAGDARSARHRFRGTRYHEESLERVIPVIEVSFDLEPHAVVRGPEQIAHPAIEWYRFDAGRKPLVYRTTIVKIADLAGNRAPLGARVDFETDCVISLVTIGMPMPERERTDWVRAMFSGAWTSAEHHGGSHVARAMWPALTACLQIAIRRLMPDLATFARCIAFRPPRDGAGACIFFIEPAGTAGTAVETMRAVLDREELRVRFVDALTKAVDALERCPNLERFVTSPHYEGPIAPADVAEIREIVSVIAGERVSQPWAPTHELGVVQSPGPADDAPWTPPAFDSTAHGFPADGTESKAPGATDHWQDHNVLSVQEWQGDVCKILEPNRPVTYGVAIGSFAADAKRDVAAFGYSEQEFLTKLVQSEEEAVKYMRSVGFRLDGGAISADYEWMIAQSIRSVEPLARAIVAQADAAGATSVRARISAIVTFVNSMRYEIPRELPDGRCRFEVRMPTDTLDRRAGDCDSMSVLALALIRAAGLAEGAVIVTHDHALIGLRIAPLPGDDWVDFPSGRYVLVECTEHTAGHRRLGRVWRELVGTAVRLLRDDAGHRAP